MQDLNILDYSENLLMIIVIHVQTAIYFLSGKALLHKCDLYLQSIPSYENDVDFGA